MNLDLSNKKALVCGSTQGIGKAIAIELAELGAEVTLLARDEDKLRAILEELPRPKGQIHDFICADFGNLEYLRKKFLTYYENGNFPIILVNNTGGPAGGAIQNAKPEEFTDAFSRHLLVNHFLVQTLLPAMKTAGYGRIINIISTSVKQPIPDLGVSNTIRAAVANWSKTLANEVAQFGITVNNILPGATMTSRLESIIAKKAVRICKSVEEITTEMQWEIPARRFADVKEIAAVVAFLASPAAGYVNGINVPVDGGRTSCL